MGLISRTSLILPAILLLFLTGLMYGQEKNSAPQTILRYTGSSTIGGFIEEASDTYEKVDFITDTGPESAGGEAAILEGRCDLAGVAREPSPEILDAGVNAVMIGRDAIAIIVHKNNPVKNLSIIQLKEIFTGKITNWKQVGGEDREIHPYITAQASATHKVFRSIVLKEESYVGCHSVKPDVNMLRTIREDQGGIGQISLSFLNASGAVKPISVEGQFPSLRNSNYSITRPLYLLHWPGRKSVEQFIAWLTAKEAQNLLQRRFIKVNNVPYNNQPLPVIRYAGSSTLGIFMENAAASYRKVGFEIKTDIESEGGETAILDRTATLGGVAREPSLKVLQAGIAPVYLGIDAIAVIVNPGNPVDNLTSEQLRNIFAGRITNWKVLGGPDLPVMPFIVGENSATHKIFGEKIMNGEAFFNCTEIKPDAEIIQKVAENKGAIGHISLAFLSGDRRVKAIKVDRIAPRAVHLGYPIIRPLYLLWREDNAEVEEFVQWVTGPEGRTIFNQHFISARSAGPPQFASGETGTLIVYTQTEAVEDGGIFYYIHQPYEIYLPDGDFLKRVENSSGTNDESPTSVMLSPGEYLIRAGISSGNQQEFPVTIQPGQTLRIDLEEGLPSGNKAGESTPKEVQQSSYLKNLKLFGDIRIRGALDRQSPLYRFRGRYRLRGGINAAIAPGLQAGLRFVSTSNPGNPNSNHVDFTQGFKLAFIAIDRAYLEYSPRKFTPLILRVGKFAHPFKSTSVYSELVWDADIQPEGGAFSLKFKEAGPFSEISLSQGAFLLSQFRTRDPSFWMSAHQISLELKASPGLKLGFMNGMHMFYGIKGSLTENGIFNSNRGNQVYSDSVGQRYQNDFYIMDNLLYADINILKIPLRIKGQLLYNFGASSENIGYTAGFSLGNLQDKGNWQLYYQYQGLMQEVIFSPVGQDDFLRVTDFKGHVVGFAWAFSRKISLNLWALIDKRYSTRETSQERFRLDLNIKF